MIGDIGLLIGILLLFPIMPVCAQDDSSSKNDEYHTEICSLYESYLSNTQWLSFTQRVEAACGIRTQESRRLLMAVTAITNELATKKAEYKAAFGHAFSTQSCSCAVNIFTISTDINDSTALIEALCNTTANLTDYEKDMKNIRSEMTKAGYAPKPIQKYQWTRDRMYLKETVTALSKVYKTRTGRTYVNSICAGSNLSE